MEALTCKRTLPLLDGYAAGELSRHEYDQVTAHIANCADCQKEARGFHLAMSALTMPHTPVQTNDLYRGFAAKLGRAEAASTRRYGQLRWAASAACLLIVVSAGASLVRQFAFAPSQPKPISEIAVAPPAPIIEPKRAVAVNTDETHSAPVNNAPPINNVRQQFSELRQREQYATRTPDAPKRIDNRPKSYTNFEDVRDANGMRAADYRNMGSSQQITLRPAVKLDLTPDRQPVVMSPQVAQSIRVGDTITSAQGASGYDSSGRLSYIRVVVEKTQVGTTGAENTPPQTNQDQG